MASLKVAPALTTALVPDLVIVYESLTLAVAGLVEVTKHERFPLAERSMSKVALMVIHHEVVSLVTTAAAVRRFEPRIRALQSPSNPTSGNLEWHKLR